MKTKSEIRPLLISFFNMISTQFNTKIKAIRIDNAQEFILKDFYADHGIYISIHVLPLHNRI